MTADAATEFVTARGVGMLYPGGQQTLREIDFTLPAGQFTAIIGPSGCGKSTLLRMIAGLQSPSQGSLTVGGMAPELARRTATRVAFVFQDPTLLPWRTVEENIRLPLELQNVAVEKRAGLIAQALQMIGLNETDAQKRPRKLSGGMRMRVSLARALAIDPELLLLDEPFAALDDVLRQQLNEELVRIWQARGWSGLFVTHNVAEAVFLSQRVLVMTARPGTILADVAIPFAYPRTAELRGTSEFARLTSELSLRLREAAR